MGTEGEIGSEGLGTGGENGSEGKGREEKLGYIHTC